MPDDDLIQALPAAEMAMAVYNAARTSAAPEPGLQRGESAHFLWLRDGSRPGSAYYDRAIVRRPGPLPAAAFDELPADLGAVELQAGQDGSPLAARGYEAVNDLLYLGRRAPAEALPEALAVQLLGPQDTDLLFDLLERSGVPFPAARRLQKAGYYEHPRFTTFLARDDQAQAMAWATLFDDSAGNAWLGNAYTLPEHRGRGAHAALLAARLNAAAARGLQRVFTDVEPDTPSQRHCERAGLLRLATHQIWVRT